MIVRVKLFAVARELAGAETVLLELPDAATVATLRKQLAEVHPPLREIVASTMFARNNEYMDENAELSHDDELACIPPVSGG